MKAIIMPTRKGLMPLALLILRKNVCGKILPIGAELSIHHSGLD
jgi:hypothetical protein